MELSLQVAAQALPNRANCYALAKKCQKIVFFKTHTYHRYTNFFLEIFWYAIKLPKFLSNTHISQMHRNFLEYFGSPLGCPIFPTHIADAQKFSRIFWYDIRLPNFCHKAWHTHTYYVKSMLCIHTMSKACHIYYFSTKHVIFTN